MQTHRSRLVLFGLIGTVLLVCTQNATAGQRATPNPGTGATEITVLYDNYTLTEGLRTDWGFACIIKGTEKNILFDTGAHGAILLENMDKLQVSAQEASLLVISHDHGDHTYGLSSFLSRNSNVLAHLPSAALVQGVIQQFRQLGVRKVGASHCTGDRAIALFKQAYGELIQHWGGNDPSADIAPPLFGDGIVDEKDLEVLMGYWHKEVLPGSLAAYWRLDEASGVVAADSAGTNNGTLLGHPTWQPAGGKVQGALLLDGVDDAISTPFILSPARGPFSVFLWAKGGAPGQVLVSQIGSANWLRAAPVGGTLQTELNEPGRNAAKNLQALVVITDGAWHHVGLVWDGANRVLYIDSVEVARGTLTGLPESVNGLRLGAGSTLAPGTFWKGLIDEVRVYDQAVTP